MVKSSMNASQQPLSSGDESSALKDVECCDCRRIGREDVHGRISARLLSDSSTSLPSQLFTTTTTTTTTKTIVMMCTSIDATINNG
jgi:hypothetical protein